MGPQDGVDYGIRAAQWVVHQQGRRDVHFAFVGGGEVLPDLQHLAGELDLDDYCSFTGWVSYDVLISYIAAADVCISPDPENGLNEHYTMNKTLEYMAVGKPQVAFDLEEQRVSAQGAAVYARPNDIEEFGGQILALLDDPDRREKMGKIGRDRIENELGWAHTHRNLLEAYDWLLG
jgi:glycosyltransferase involved in cell wall biosynthesis